MIYLTGDTHGSFKRIGEFCNRFATTSNDVLIILGDAGINFSGWVRDLPKKEYLSSLPITVFCIHGNHEMRPESIGCYDEIVWNEGTVYVEKEFPNILFAKDGEMYDFDGVKVIAIGGAYSIDKYYRLQMGYPWFKDEQPSDEIKKRVEDKLTSVNWKVDVVLSHTVPYNYRPVDAFLTDIDDSGIDTSTEEWLQSIEDRLDYKRWYCGHYHLSRRIDKIQLMFEDYMDLRG